MQTTKLSREQLQDIRKYLDSSLAPALNEWCKRTGLKINMNDVDYDFSAGEESGLSFTINKPIDIEKLIKFCIETYPKNNYQAYTTNKHYEVIKNKYHFIITRDSYYASHQYTVSCEYWCMNADYTEEAEEVAFCLSNDINYIKNIICSALFDVLIANCKVLAEMYGYDSVEELSYKIYEAEEHY